MQNEIQEWIFLSDKHPSDRAKVICRTLLIW